MKKFELGLVLSGGGTRGVAHAGALKFLMEKNIHPEVLACCSAGSIVGTLYAIKKSPEEIMDFSSRFIFSTGIILLLISPDLFPPWFFLSILIRFLEKRLLMIWISKCKLLPPN